MKIAKPPADFHTLAVRLSVGMVLALTVVTVAWSTWSIGSLFGGGLIGYAAAVVFDFGWAMALLLEFMARYDAAKRRFPTILGWVLLIVTMLAIGTHGLVNDNIPMAVFGAFVSAFAKLLWMGVMRHVHVNLSHKDAKTLHALMSDAQATSAFAQAMLHKRRLQIRAAMSVLAIDTAAEQASEAYGDEIKIDELLSKVSLERETPVNATATGAGELPTGATGPTTLALVSPTYGDLPKSGAIRLAVSQHPDASPEQIAEALAKHGVEVEPPYVRTALARKPEPEPEREPEAEIIALHQ